jgi:hypothetical protein
MKLALLVVVAGCSQQVAPADPDPTGVLVQNGACSALEGIGFTSLSQGECGLGPDGVSQCSWHIAFDARDSAFSDYTWHHSDVEEAARVECHGRALTGYSFDGQARYTGSYDSVTRILTWDGAQYAR